MKRISFLLLAAFASIACSSSTDPAEDTTDSNITAADPDKATCASIGGECVGLAPSSCQGGTWADADAFTCGDALGSGCCVKPQPPPPPPPPPPPTTDCESKGGECVGLSPSSCQHGVFADASSHSCGGAVGVGCCVACPALSPPGPGFCPDGEIQPRKDEAGCVRGFDCVTPASE